MILLKEDLSGLKAFQSAQEGKEFLQKNFKLVKRKEGLELRPNKWFWRMVFLMFKPLIVNAIRQILEKLGLEELEDIFKP